jgi:hypothetical protein
MSNLDEVQLSMNWNIYQLQFIQRAARKLFMSFEDFVSLSAHQVARVILAEESGFLSDSSAIVQQQKIFHERAKKAAAARWKGHRGKRSKKNSSAIVQQQMGK